MSEEELAKERDRRVAEFHATHDEVYRLRGQFLSGCVSIEHLLGAVLDIFFQPNDREVFLTMIVGYVGVHEKVRCIVELAGKDLTTAHRATLKEVNKLVDVRNEIAHSTVGVDLQSTEEAWLGTGDLKLVSHRPRRAGGSQEAATVTDLKAKVAWVEDVGSQVMQLMIDMTWVADGRGVLRERSKVPAAPPPPSSSGT
jgi:hypothetical protein